MDLKYGWIKANRALHGYKEWIERTNAHCTMDLKYKWIKVNCVLQRVNQSNECALDVGFKVQMNKS